jgi:hypothetical protein
LPAHLAVNKRYHFVTGLGSRVASGLLQALPSVELGASKLMGRGYFGVADSLFCDDAGEHLLLHILSPTSTTRPYAAQAAKRVGMVRENFRKFEPIWSQKVLKAARQLAQAAE